METYKNFIGGRWVASQSDKTVYNINPANTEDVLGIVPLSTRDEARQAIEAAHEAFQTWRKMPAPQRERYVRKTALLMEERKEELARTLTREEGKVLSEARGEVQKTINILWFWAGQGSRLQGRSLESELANNYIYTMRVPLGVVGAITPWNFPLSIPAWKTIPALVCGNTVVLKPATLTPATAVMLMEVLEEAGFPDGTVNMVIGSGSQVGDELVNNPLLRAISFTGSNEVGNDVYDQAAARAAKCQCEMGGKNPLVVLRDADLPLAVESAAMGGFGSTGQRCTATSRVIIEEAVADEFAERLVKRATELKVGPGLDEASEVGPSVEEGQMNKVLEYMEVGQAEGARLLCGGSRLTDGELAQGFYPAPTVFDGVDIGMRIAQEEIFGPVVSVIRVKDFDEAVHAANAVEYGLTSSIYSNDYAKVMKFIEEIETGITHVNSPTLGGEAHVPFGGMKGTGIGVREIGPEAVEFFTELKTVYLDYTGARREGKFY